MIESPHVASDSSNCLCLLMGKFGVWSVVRRGAPSNLLTRQPCGAFKYDGLLRSGNIPFSPHVFSLPALGV